MNLTVSEMHRVYKDMIKDNEKFIKEIDVNDVLFNKIKELYHLFPYSYDYTNQLLSNLYNMSMVETINFQLDKFKFINHFKVLALVLGVYKTADFYEVNNKISIKMKSHIKINKKTNQEFVYNALQHYIFNTLIHTMEKIHGYKFINQTESSECYSIIEKTLNIHSHPLRELICLNFFSQIMTGSGFEDVSTIVFAETQKLIKLNEKMDTRKDGCFIIDVRSFLCNNIKLKDKNNYLENDL